MTANICNTNDKIQCSEYETLPPPFQVHNNTP